MIKIRLFCIYDSVAEVYEAPFYGRTRGEGERIFADVMQMPEQKYSKHMDNYSLFEIGEFDLQTGVLSGFEKGPQIMGNAVSLVRREA